VKVIVAGAGIGGLTAALSLHAAGIDVLVIDAAVTLQPLGVGINLLPHAVRELTELGLGDALAATGIPTAEHVHFDRHGNRIWGFASGLNIGYRWPQYSIHRGELQMILLDAVRARLGRQAVRTGTVFTEFTQSPSGVQVVVRDRGSGTVSVLPADVLVGADGLYSGVRAQLHPGEPAPCWPTATCPPTGCCTWSACGRPAGSAGSRTCSAPRNWPPSTRPTGRPRCRRWPRSTPGRR